MNFTFELPHWVYWGLLIFIPIIVHLGAQRAAKAQAEAERIARPSGDDLVPVDLMKNEAQLLREELGRQVAFCRISDRISIFFGNFVAYWSAIAVVVYSYEVISRYALNAPTNWAHESMFLMYGMMYVLSGAYALTKGAHVRVDVLYSLLPLRWRSGVDIIGFPIMLAFVLAMIWTGWVFFAGSMDQDKYFFATGPANERSFTEWGIPYWPMKFALLFGSILLLVSALSEFIKDLKAFQYHSRGAAAAAKE